MANGEFKVGDYVCVRDSNLCGSVRAVDEGGNVALVDETNAEWSLQSGDLDSYQTVLCGKLLDEYRTNETLRNFAKPRFVQGPVGYKFSLGYKDLAKEYGDFNAMVKNIASAFGCPSVLFTSEGDSKTSRSPLLVSLDKIGKGLYYNKPYKHDILNFPQSPERWKNFRAY